MSRFTIQDHPFVHWATGLVQFGPNICEDLGCFSVRFIRGHFIPLSFQVLA